MPRINIYSPSERPISCVKESDLVTRLDIPDFHPLPEVILLGERHFIQWGDETSRMYVEAHCYVVPVKGTFLKLGQNTFGKVMEKRYRL